MEQLQQPSRRTLLIGIGAVVGLIILVTVVSILVFGVKKNNGSLADGLSGAPASSGVDVKAALSDAEAELKQSSDNQKAAKEALDDSDKRIKVSD